MSSFDAPLGFASECSLRELWNCEKLRTMRLRMLAGQPCAECWRCREHENAGGPSLRSIINSKFARHAGLTRHTAADGSLPDFRLYYWDVRFSNVCNFRCRTCDAYLSSSWYDDESVLLNAAPRRPRVLDLTALAPEVKQFLFDSSDVVEEIYFAGGEPLMMAEHYEILDLLVSRKRSDVRLTYNTNLSRLHFRNRAVTGLWKLFEHVAVHASLDGYGARGEILRKGQNWETTERNIRLIREEASHVAVSVCATISALNLLHLPEFHRYMVERELVGINDLHLNILLFPPEYRSQILPAPLKAEARRRIERHLRFLADGGAGETLIRQFMQLLAFTEAEDRSSDVRAFIERNRKLDAIRNENCAAVFPELAELYQTIHNAV